MNVKTIILAAMSIQSILTDNNPHNRIPDDEQKRIEEMLNQVRAETGVEAANMRYVKYNYAVQQALQDYVQEHGAYSFNVPPFGKTVMDDPKMAAQFPTWSYLFHDTCGNEDTGISGIFQFRGVRQRRCYRYYNCDPNEYTDYYSCFNTELPKTTNCNWFFQYYPLMVRSDLKQIACVKLGIPGRVNLHKQPNSFFCYGQFVNIKNKPIEDHPDNDVSYKEGPRCSDCPDDQEFCYKKALCVSYDMTKKPTTAPTTKMPTTTKIPTDRPTKKPTPDPTTKRPTAKPTSKSPTSKPIKKPTMDPTTRMPTFKPTTRQPTTHKPTTARPTKIRMAVA